jgi:hypothetical protein
MPGVDFDVLRGEITMQQVLDEIGFRATHRDGDQLRGMCPVHGSTSENSRVFSVNLSTRRYYCHKCKSHGNQFECRLSHNPCRNRAVIRWSNGFLRFGGMSAGGGCDVPVLEGRV